MKLTVEGKTMARALDLVRGALPAKSTLPIVGTVHLIARRETEPFDRGVLTLKTTDLEQAIRAEIPCAITEPGERCILGAKLIEVVKELAHYDELRLEGTGVGGLQVRAKSGRWSITGLDPQDFPKVDPGETTATATVKAESLATAIRSVAFAASDDEVRFALNGIRVRIAPTRAQLTATDGHRMVELFVPLERGPEAPLPDIILPSNAIRGLLGLLKGRDVATLSLSRNYLHVDVEGGALSARLIEGQYPNSDAVLTEARKREHHAVIAASDLARALRQASVMAEARNKPAKLEFGPEALVIRSQATELGEAEVITPLAWQAVPPRESITVGLNAGYLLEYLGIVSGDLVIGVKDGMSPMFVTGKPTEDGQATAPDYVLMPMRL
jgi:DNA polymerase-3 subunit beta